MKICILGIGVIGTIYGYAFQKSGHEVEHLIRENKKPNAPSHLSVHLLDGRYNQKGGEKEDSYSITLAQPGTTYDFIIVSVARGSVENALKTIDENRLDGSILLFCNFWNSRNEIEAMIGPRPYIIGFPTAGGRMENQTLDCALFDHIMLEDKAKTNISNYKGLLTLVQSADLKTEIPYDMVEWIWLHMAINAGVTSTAAGGGSLSNPRQLALNLMGDSRALAETVRTVRETIQVVSARGADLKHYRSEIIPYRLPAAMAGAIMKRMFANNELTRRIMTLHSDIGDILYGCTCIYQTAKENHLDLPRYFEKMERVLDMTGFE